MAGHHNSTILKVLKTFRIQVRLTLGCIYRVFLFCIEDWLSAAVTSTILKVLKTFRIQARL